eukprot:scaffold21.g2097.t1
MKGKKSPGASFYDRLLVPRIEAYGQNHDYTDIDEVAEYLRSAYREYARQKAGPFRAQVSRAVEAVARRSGVAKPELQLQALEDRHRGRQGRGEGGGGGASSGSSGSESGSGDSSTSGEDIQVDGDLAADADSGRKGRGMNRSMLNLYGSVGKGGEGEEAGGGQAPAAEGPAFAPLHVIAAAAARAAAEAQLKAAARTPGRQQLDEQRLAEQQREPQGAPASMDASGGAAAERAVPASTSGKPEPAPSASGRAAPSTAAKGKRGGATPSERAASKRPRTGAAARGSSLVAAPRAVTYADLGGIEGVLDDIRELIEYPLKHPEVYGWLGVEPPRGVLLHGPPGCGKTALANAIANECGVPFLRVSAPEVVSGMSGESEAKIRQLFQEAAANAPCIVFIDEIDAIAPKREQAQREMERRIVAQMLTCLDDLSSLFPRGDAQQQGEGEQGGAVADSAGVLLEGKHVVVIGATNRPDALDAALRRAGRFDREISLGIPSEAARCKILQVLSRRLRLAGDFDFQAVAKRTPGFVGADLQALMKEAAALAVKRIFGQLEAAEAAGAGAAGVQAVEQHEAAGQEAAQVEEAVPEGLAPQRGGPAAATPPAGRLGRGPLSASELVGLAVTMADFEAAISKVQPSVRREGFTTTPDVTWDDVGSLGEVREELSFAITQPIAHPALFEAMGLAAATGVLLFGPPGCGKTLVAKAVAAESGANFISIKGPELLNKYVGESERAVRQLFSRARAAAPCVLFFDEMDALAPRRGSDVAQSSERVVNQLLTEMDGIDGRQGVYLVAATNRPDMIDPALLRPGRLDKILYVPLPPPDGRALTRGAPLAEGVDLQAVGSSQRLTGFSGADLAALVREACVMALKESMAAAAAGGAPGGATATAARAAAPAPRVEMRHFEAAMGRVQPSVSRKDGRMYEALRAKLRSTRGHLPSEAAPSEAPPPPEAPAADEPQGMEASAENNNEEAPMEEEPGVPS